MANIAIRIMIGNSPENFVVGNEYYFGCGEDESKINPKDVQEKLKDVIETHLFEVYGMPRKIEGVNYGNAEETAENAENAETD